jgi:hypothetical protein
MFGVLYNICQSLHHNTGKFFTKTDNYYARPNQTNQKITGTPEIVTVDFATMFNESYIDPAEEMKQQPVALSIGTSVYKDNSYPIPFGSYGDFSCIVEQKPKTLNQ